MDTGEDRGYRPYGYHVNTKTKEGGRCRARRGRCPFGGISGYKNHYNTLAESEAAAERMLHDEYGTFTTLKKQKYEDEATYLERMIRDEYPDEMLLSIGLSGSHMYGLHHDASDYDFMVVVEGKGRNVQRFMGESDFREFPYEEFRQMYENGSTEVVESVHGGAISFKGTKYEHIWGATRMNTLKYMSATSSSSYDTLRRAEQKLYDETTPKTLRVAARSMIMFAKCQYQRLDFDPRLTPMEQRFVWDNVEILHEKLHEGHSVEQIHAELTSDAESLYPKTNRMT